MQTNTDEKKKQRPKHKPMFAAEQISTMAAIKDQLKLFEEVSATEQPVPSTESTAAIESPPPATPVMPAAKKRKLSDRKEPSCAMSMPSPEMTPAAVPPIANAASPKQHMDPRRRSSSATLAAEDEDPFCPNEVKELIGKLNRFGLSMERALSGITARANKLVVGDDAESIKARLSDLEKDWKLSNRAQMQKMVEYMERQGIAAIGGVEVPSTPLDQSVQPGGVSSSKE